MSWFDQGNERISESDLIAYHLHELSPGRERAVARALEASAALAAHSAVIEATLHAAKDTPQPIDPAAFTRVWTALRPALMPYSMPLAAKPRWRAPILAKAAFAGLAMAGVGLVAVRHYKPAGASAAPAVLATIGGTTDVQQSAEHAMDGTSQDVGQRTIARPGPVTRVPSTLRFRGQLSTDLSRSGLQQDEVSSIHLPASPPLSPAPAGLAASPVTTPAQPAIPAGNNAQTPSATTAGMEKNKSHGPKSSPTSHGTDVMLALGGNFILGHTSLVAGTEPYTQTATHAIAAVGAFHQQLRPLLGYRVTLSYSRPDFQYSYTNSTGGTSGGEINSRIFEAAGTYVVQGPHHGRWSTTADAGAALMAFLPTQNSSASYAYRPAAVLGANVDYAIGKHWAARAAYRAQLFRTPNFRYTGGVIPVTTSLIVGQEPSVGIVYRFGKIESRRSKP